MQKNDTKLFSLFFAIIVLSFFPTSQNAFFDTYATFFLFPNFFVSLRDCEEIENKEVENEKVENVKNLTKIFFELSQL